MLEVNALPTGYLHEGEAIPASPLAKQNDADVFWRRPCCLVGLIDPPDANGTGAQHQEAQTVVPLHPWEARHETGSSVQSTLTVFWVLVFFFFDHTFHLVKLTQS